ncbi:hypothetical protein DMB44_05975 [Thermoplasma sp. Kam2015]|uniref:NAD(P)/FAD-dependent oxidoreductase n=1 Tax=Thermoplasma sp. Kam2015 TaxID=2094122 RepID=UPI000D8F34E4|nr:NAD(P)/FAD-dependent oxidoreductase [Thermoplasma sp. Kam2015]PYB68047.1 hypothetical protein DMB44_05975 [Thermoplasma sp. Kam2015]
MKISVMGLGISGLYLYKRLKKSGFDVDAFDVKRPNHYIPCAYGTNFNQMKEYMSKIDLDFEGYVLHWAENVTFAGENGSMVDFRPSGLITFDRNRLQEDLRRDIDIKNNRETDIIVDATGVSRYYLGQTPDDVTYFTKEYLTDSQIHDDFYFLFLKNGSGYLWEFPLGSGLSHVGVGSIRREDLAFIDAYRRLRITGRKIRMKPLFEKAVKGNIIGIGEAIGTVSPLTGEGIIPSIESAELLYRSISEGGTLNEIEDRYVRSLKKNFSAYYALSEFVSRVQRGMLVNFSNIRYLPLISRDLRHFGIDFSLSKALKAII